MIVLLVILLLVALVFGLGAALKVAFWTLLIAAAVIVVLGLLVRNMLSRG
ncbi:MAG TPA: hypothetical protein VM184_08935 [Gaiellaceae bacterium]|nr:hypothetical protein [Gaiellaceae bacterium]